MTNNPEQRTATVTRETTETSISVSLTLDADKLSQGICTGKTGIGFLDHMLQLLVSRGRFNLELKVKGDLQVDGHHTVEDLGLCLGRAFSEALGDRKGIRRYGYALLPMDEALVLVALDFSGRPYLAYDLPLAAARLGELDAELLPEFLRALCQEAGLTLHVKKLDGKNSHHITEALFKGLGEALRQAVSLDERVAGVPSTKGTLNWFQV